MNIHEAISSGLPFKRKIWDDKFLLVWNPSAKLIEFAYGENVATKYCDADLIANDWIVKKPKMKPISFFPKEITNGRGHGEYRFQFQENDEEQKRMWDISMPERKYRITIEEL